jgi:hypothetical protein
LGWLVATIDRGNILAFCFPYHVNRAIIEPGHILRRLGRSGSGRRR